VQELDVPFYLHPCDPHDMPHMYRGHPELLGATWSWTVETATHALRMVFGGTFDRFPGVTLCSATWGRPCPICCGAWTAARAFRREPVGANEGYRRR
jgi:2,3-dihydroxybenzoate decarboxylase